MLFFWSWLVCFHHKEFIHFGMKLMVLGKKWHGCAANNICTITSAIMNFRQAMFIAEILGAFFV